ncbi:MULTISPECIES: RidA family protein [Legionella]|uniref:2-aminomuconate deaminase n=1 Tax=Legionella drozanskii LLAP-1 TaxID=1212489 RepID=A0A0W0TBZ0_9GAMM|nr:MULTISPECIES: RidA family protein [Legionella]KTC93112.1 2-aminomuconate deaminase [Legionella drozanskii LLAP-1]PJE11695.1 MAG: RidA family protein [Legionella sp.]
MPKEVIEVPELLSYDKYGFTQCVRYNDLIFVTGQAGEDKNGNLVGKDIESQTRQLFKNIEHALRAANSDLSQVLAMTSYIVDMEKNGLAYFTTRKQCMPVSSYTSTSVGVAALANPGLLIEVTCIAALAR